MLKCQPVDEVFRALGDPTRRNLVERLGAGSATVSELARPLDMTLSAVVQHLAVLEACGLVSSEKVGRTRHCRLEPVGLAAGGGLVRRPARRLGAPARPAGRGPGGRSRGRTDIGTSPPTPTTITRRSMR